MSMDSKFSSIIHQLDNHLRKRGKADLKAELFDMLDRKQQNLNHVHPGKVDLQTERDIEVIKAAIALLKD
ncbi:hypothetical protein V6R21_04845 [Limibacter armeniacum]|uniref:hypothetical protein n=1 Tax=Limibacter armeniacum TaxID=466084 RepID=UPI002FE5F155